jgi:ATP-dependent Clp protease ATP-binding subunit ClpA
MLLGRGRECGELDELLDAVRRGESRALVLRGEPGVGKTALLDYAVTSARGFKVAPGLPDLNQKQILPSPHCTRSARRFLTI